MSCVGLRSVCVSKKLKKKKKFETEFSADPVLSCLIKNRSVKPCAYFDLQRS